MPYVLNANGKKVERDADWAIPHHLTFAGLFYGGSKSYLMEKHDEALRDSRLNALSMMRDPWLMSLIRERIRGVTRCKWHLEVDNPDDPWQKRVCDGLTKALGKTPHLTDMVRQWGWSVWYGRYGVQPRWTWDVVTTESGVDRVLRPGQHKPVNGDKLVYTWDDHWGVMVNQAEAAQFGPDYKLINTNLNPALLLTGAWAESVLIHKFEAFDQDYFHGEQAGGVAGVGLRHWCYWGWNLRDELLSWIIDHLERSGLGIVLLQYDQSNEEARKAAEHVAKSYSRRHVITLPVPPGLLNSRTPGGAYGIQVVETPTAGVEVLDKLRIRFEEQIERFIIGQGMSDGTDANNSLGGTGRAQFAQKTKADLIAEDAESRAEYLTGSPQEPGLVSTMLRWSYPWADFPVRWVFDLETVDVEAKLNAFKTFVEMGGTVKEDEVREVIGASKPGPEDAVLGGQQAMAGQPGAGGLPGQPGAGPDEAGEEGDDDWPGLEDDAEPFSRAGVPSRYAFDESKHPRGQPENAGQFGPGGSKHEGGAAGGPVQTGAPAPAPEAKPAPIHEVQQPTGFQKKWKPGVEPWQLRRNQFDNDYRQHSVTGDDPEAALRGIQSEGFRSQRVNLLPVTTGEPMNIMDANYGTQEGRIYLAVPVHHTDDTRSGRKIKSGWKPTESEVVRPRYNHQPLHEAIVEAAIAAGKPVPSEVLADYPDIVAQLKAGEPSRYAFDEAKHHRGQPENAGQFGPGGGQPASGLGGEDAARAERKAARKQGRHDFQSVTAKIFRGMEITGEGDDIEVEVGSRSLVLEYDPKSRSVNIDFTRTDAPLGENSFQQTGETVQAGTLEFARQLTGFAKALGEKNLGISYETLEPRRARIYARVLSAAGFQPVKGGTGIGKVLWRKPEEIPEPVRHAFDASGGNPSRYAFDANQPRADDGTWTTSGIPAHVRPKKKDGTYPKSDDLYAAAGDAKLAVKLRKDIRLRDKRVFDMLLTHLQKGKDDATEKGQKQGDGVEQHPGDGQGGPSAEASGRGGAQEGRQVQEDEIADVLTAIEEGVGTHNMLSLADLRDEMVEKGITDRAGQDAALKSLWAAGKITFSQAEGRHGLTQREQDALLPHGNDALGFVHLRPEK